jgi:hypothetical protein
MMRRMTVGRRPAALLATFVIALMAPVALPPSAGAVTCRAPHNSPSVGANSTYAEIAVLRPCRAWVVGDDGTGSLIEFWNGKKWIHQTSDEPGASSNLAGVTALSPTNAWAVGTYLPSSYAGYIEHWNGKHWKGVKSPTLVNGNFFESVSAASAHDIWVVGQVNNGSAYVSLILHWNGMRWKIASHPQPGASSGFYDVDARAADDVWAVGFYLNGSSGSHNLIEHWDGKTWRRVPAPNRGGASANNTLYGVSARSDKDAWAVGYANNVNGFGQTLIERWNGKTWKVLTSPNPTGGLRDNELNDVAGVGPSDAWAVGYASQPSGVRAIVFRWNGHSWKQHPSGLTGLAPAQIRAVKASSANDVWWAGDADVAASQVARVVHCC